MHILDAVPSEAKIIHIVMDATFGKRPFCPRCGSSHVRRSESRFRCPKCRKPFSLISVSWLKGTKLSLRELWLLLYCWQKKMPFDKTLEITDLSHLTVRRWRRKFQEHLVYESPILKGLVEVDEAFLGRRRHGNQQIVLGALSRKQGKVVMRCTKDRDTGTTDKFLLAHVETKDTTVFTDSAGCYDGIDSFFGYEHIVCNHSEFVFGPTNRIEATWSKLKRMIRRVYHHFHKQWLPLFLREFEARVNNPEIFENPLSYLQNSLLVVPTR